MAASHAKKDPPPSSMSVFQSDKMPLMRTARPAFTLAGGGSSQPPSTLLFVNVGSAQSREEKRQIRAHIMFTTHEARRRQGTQGRKSSNKNPEEDQQRVVYLPATENPLQDASVMCEDPFDSLPVKSFPGMHELVEYCTSPPLCISDHH